MIQNDQELEAILTHIGHFQKQIEKLREMEGFDGIQNTTPSDTST